MVKNKFKISKTLPVIILLITYSIPLNATVRYVSHSGSNTPPYLTWETAADSIMSAINISVFGDTIFVANGVYEEQVVMIPGLSLIGAGLDSTVIDARDFVVNWNSIAVEIADSSLLKGFKIIVSNNIEIGMGIAGSGSSNSLVTLNRVTSALIGIFLDATFFGISDISVYKNICDEVRIGIEMFNSNSVVRKNAVYTAISSETVGIRIGAFDFSYKPIIDSNYIVAEGLSYTAAVGIYKSFGASPIITRNTIILKGPQNDGIFLGDSDSGKVFNNLIVAAPGDWGIKNFAIPYLQLYNNYTTGNFDDREYVIIVGSGNIVKNNVVTNAKRGVRVWTNENPVFQYNNVWNNDVNYSGFTPDSTNLSVDPMIMNDDSTQGKLDFHLQKYSPLIDAGDPDILDLDGTRSDIGLYGGPYGERYEYVDLPPKPPRNLTAVVDSQNITINWNKNTEADFNSYNLFSDTTANFTADTTNFVASLTETFYIQIIPDRFNAFYYKLTATDNQGNESQPSEELAVIITSVNEYSAAVSNYQLYQNHPNPFNPSTIIDYSIKNAGRVTIKIYDILGREVKTLVNENKPAGSYKVEFNASSLPSGVYLYRLNSGKYVDVKKMILLR